MDITIPYYSSISAFIKDQHRIEKENNMNLLLKDLKPGDVFEYVDAAKSYRRGKFLVLDPNSEKDGIFIFSDVTNKTCRHWGQLDVNLIPKIKENNMKNSMGHFINWRFGVPVKVHAQLQEDQEAVSGDVRLIREDGHYFNILTKNGIQVLCNKNFYSYELIPHKYSNYSSRYPVCSSPDFTAFCNSRSQMTTFDAVGEKLQPYPVATPTINGKTIELSAETTAELKKKLGI